MRESVFSGDAPLREQGASRKDIAPLDLPFKEVRIEGSGAIDLGTEFDIGGDAPGDAPGDNTLREWFASRADYLRFDTGSGDMLIVPKDTQFQTCGAGDDQIIFFSIPAGKVGFTEFGVFSGKIYKITGQRNWQVEPSE